MFRILVVLLLLVVLQGESQAQRLSNGRGAANFAARLAKQEMEELRRRGADAIANPDGLVHPMSRQSSEQEITDACKEGKNWMPWLSPDRKLKKGSVGRLRFPPAVHGVPSHDHADVNVVQVIDGDNAIIRFFGQRYWLKGVKTEDFIDGEKVLLLGILEVTGSRQYATAGGSTSTVTMIEKNDFTDKVEEASRNVSANPPANENIFRVWKTNRSAIVGKLKEYKAGKVIFELKNGSSVTVKTKDITKESRKKLTLIRKSMKSKK